MRIYTFLCSTLKAYVLAQFTAIYGIRHLLLHLKCLFHTFVKLISAGIINHVTHVLLHYYLIISNPAFKRRILSIPFDTILTIGNPLMFHFISIQVTSVRKP